MSLLKITLLLSVFVFIATTYANESDGEESDEDEDFNELRSVGNGEDDGEDDIDEAALLNALADSENVPADGEKRNVKRLFGRRFRRFVRRVGRGIRRGIRRAIRRIRWRRVIRVIRTVRDGTGVIGKKK